MTNPIPTAAIEAGAKARAEARGTDWENLKHTFPGMANNIRTETRATLKAAMPRIRKQVADEIRAEMPALTTRAATQTLRVCMEHAARIAEGEAK